ncbi:MAG: leader peptide processing enzyme [Treponema sp.]|nr:leader peptide processing enzyme [Treponema sp.]
MNKKVNTLFFIIGATLFNILITVLFFLLLLVVYARFIMPGLPEGAQAWAFPMIFIASIAASFAIYRFALKLLLKKIEMEKYFDPIISSKRRRP